MEGMLRQREMRDERGKKMSSDRVGREKLRKVSKREK